MRMRHCCRIAGLACFAGGTLLHTGIAAAMETSVLQALDLADNTVVGQVQKSTLSLFTEAATVINEAGGNVHRLSLDLRWDTLLLPSRTDKVRLVVSNRTDTRFFGALGHNGNVNALREAYLSYKASSATIIDAGRINTRYGVALGYNPTDFLGKNTVRSVISADPETLRTNRLGNVMVRLQQFWDNAAVTAIVSPELGDKPNDAAFSPDWGRSNPKDRLLLSASYKFGDNFNPQVIYYQESGSSPQFGLNVSRVLSRSVLMYTEWAGGRQPLAWQKKLPADQQDTQWRNRAAVGATWTSDKQMTLRLEGHYNGSADSKKAAEFFSRMPLGAINAAPAALSDNLPDAMASRKSVLFQVYQKDIIENTDVNLILQRDLQQSKTMGFAEIRRHWGQADIAVQWQKTYALKEKGNAGFDVRPEQRWQFLVSYYF